MNILFYESLKQGNLSTWSIHVYEVVSNLSELGHHVVLLNRDPPRYVNKIDISQQSWREHLKKNLFQSRITRPFAGVVTILGLFLLELKAFISAFITIVREKERFDVIYRRSRVLNSEYILAKLFKIPLVKEENGIYVDELKAQKRGDRVSLWLIDKIERFTKPRTDRLIVVTSKLKEVLQKDFRVPGDKITVIPNGANIDLFKPIDVMEARKELGLTENCSYICFVGKLVEWQGLEFLLASIPLVLRTCPEARLLVVGDGLMKQKLVELVNLTGMSDKVIFAGIVPYSKVPLYINASNVCVFSATSDFRNNRMGTSPLKLHEYMACGKPVVTGNLEGDTQEIADSGSGLVVDSTNAEEMAGAFITLLKDEQVRREMGERARKLVVEKYSWRKNAEQVAEVCRSAIKQNTRARD
jgi:glycosyltransferase involved in cell wall biosynthesis